MKKILTLLLALSLILSLSACGSSDEKKPSVNSVESVEQTETPAAVDKESEAITTAYTLGETVIADNEGFSFTITGIDPDGTWGFTVEALLENKSDKTLMFSWEDVSVMGYMVDPFWAEEVAAGKKANCKISFSNSSLEDCGIDAVDEIVFKLHVYDSDDWMADALCDEFYTIYPTGLDADSVIYPERVSVEGETTIVDNEYCTFIIEKAYRDDIWGYTLRCFVENKTEHTIMFSWDDVSVNGFMADPFWANSVAAGKCEYVGISFSDSEFEENGIEEVSDIEFTLRLSNDDTWSDIFSEVFIYQS